MNDKNNNETNVCTHDDIAQRITQQNNTDYTRNPFTGELEITYDVVKETYHDSVQNKCEECGESFTSLDDSILNAPDNFKWDEKVFDVILHCNYWWIKFSC